MQTKAIVYHIADSPIIKTFSNWPESHIACHEKTFFFFNGTKKADIAAFPDKNIIESKQIKSIVTWTNAVRAGLRIKKGEKKKGNLPMTTEHKRSDLTALGIMITLTSDGGFQSAQR